MSSASSNTHHRPVTMSFGNLPVIKTLMSRTKRGQRMELTPDMISPPLGDFRHVMHVGRKGEVFGDTSFLSNYMEKRRQNRWNYITHKLSHAGWINSARPSFRGRTEQSTSPPPPPISPIIKNAISLPTLANRSWDDGRDEDKDIDTQDIWNSISETNSPYGNPSGYSTLPRLPRSEEPSEDTSSHQLEEDGSSAGIGEGEDASICTVPLELSSSLWRSDSMESFVIDFGPSLISQILGETEALQNSQHEEQGSRPTYTSISNKSESAENNDWEHFEPTYNIQEPESLSSREQTPVMEEMEVDTEENVSVLHQRPDAIRVLWDSDEEPALEL
ncbi:cdc42 effector protein 1 [Bombina bombina]|uniref:cdc42 effector protein 1 n=1 Tax=Bombina bombina TaxID=8345 RepID=UPI00235ADAA3|nr:cdc42 effector protein 1 [Bombina bombina]